MIGKIIKIVLVSLCIIFFIYAYFCEAHKILSLSDEKKSKIINGSELIETTTFDGLMLKGKKLFDIYSLTPEILQEKDCST